MKTNYWNCQINFEATNIVREKHSAFNLKEIIKKSEKEWVRNEKSKFG